MAYVKYINITGYPFYLVMVLPNDSTIFLGGDTIKGMSIIPHLGR